MTIVTWPVVSRDRVVHAFRPGGTASAEGPFRTLRAHGWATSGVRVARSSGRHLAGQLTLFSALNVDAARLARHGQGAAAARITRAVEVLERGPEFRRLGQMLSELPDDVAQDVIDGSVRRGISAELTETLQAVARHTEQLRADESSFISLAEIIAGRVTEVHEGYVILARLSGPPAAVPRWMAVAARRERVGELLALVMDKLDAASAVVEAVPAIEYEESQTARDFSPFGRDDARIRRLSPDDEELLSGDPAPLKILVPVLIEA